MLPTREAGRAQRVGVASLKWASRCGVGPPLAAGGDDAGVGVIGWLRTVPAGGELEGKVDRPIGMGLEGAVDDCNGARRGRRRFLHRDQHARRRERELVLGQGPTY